MKALFAALLIQLVTIGTFAAAEIQEQDKTHFSGTAIAISDATPTTTLDDKSFSFILGYGTLEDGDSQTGGTGITTAAEWNINRYIGVGASYASYDPSGDNFNMISGYLTGTPVHYSYENLKFSAGAQLGAARVGNNSDAGDINNNAYYLGLALEGNYNNNIGLRIENRMASGSYSYSSVGLVGYY